MIIQVNPERTSGERLVCCPGVSSSSIRPSEWVVQSQRKPHQVNIHSRTHKHKCISKMSCDGSKGQTRTGHRAVCEFVYVFVSWPGLAGRVGHTIDGEWVFGAVRLRLARSFNIERLHLALAFRVRVRVCAIVVRIG